VNAMSQNKIKGFQCLVRKEIMEIKLIKINRKCTNPDCKDLITNDNAIPIGVQVFGSNTLFLFNCPNCNSTLCVKVIDEQITKAHTTPSRLSKTSN